MSSISRLLAVGNACTPVLRASYVTGSVANVLCLLLSAFPTPGDCMDGFMVKMDLRDGTLVEDELGLMGGGDYSNLGHRGPRRSRLP